MSTSVQTRRQRIEIIYTKGKAAAADADSFEEPPSLSGSVARLAVMQKLHKVLVVCGAGLIG